MACSTVSYSGYDASITGWTGISESYEWHITETEAALEAPRFGSQWMYVVSGLKGYTGTISARGATRPDIGSHAGVAFKTATSGITLTGDILVTNVVTNAVVDGVVDFTAEFTGCGALVET